MRFLAENAIDLKLEKIGQSRGSAHAIRPGQGLKAVRRPHQDRANPEFRQWLENLIEPVAGEEPNRGLVALIILTEAIPDQFGRTIRPNAVHRDGRGDAFALRGIDVWN